jgi:hypothetical protein
LQFEPSRQADPVASKSDVPTTYTTQAAGSGGAVLVSVAAASYISGGSRGGPVGPGGQGSGSSLYKPLLLFLSLLTQTSSTIV